MGRFDSSIATARRLLVKNGERIVLRVAASGAPDPVQPWRPSAGTKVEVPAYAVFIPYNDQGRTPRTYADGTLARVGDLQVFAEADGLSLQPDLDTLLVRADGSLWSIKAVKLLDPNGQKLLNELWIRQ